MKEKTSTTTNPIRRAFGVSLSIMMLILALLPTRAAAQNASGTGWALWSGGTLYLTANDATSLQNSGILPQVKTVSVNDNVTGIGANTLKGCVNLTNVVLGNLQTIGSNAFEGCTSLKEIDLPETMKELGQEAFKGCTGLERLGLNEGLESIGPYAFDGCVMLERLALPASVKSLQCDNVTYIEALKGSSIKSLQIAPGNPYFAEENNVLFNKDKTTLLYYPEKAVSSYDQYTIPEGVTAILNQAFFSNLTLEEVILPAHVTTLGSKIFSSSRKLKKATIQGDVSSMKGMFGNCPLLETVTIESKTPPADFDDRTFSSCPALTSIVVDGRSVEAYKSKLNTAALKALVKGSYAYADLDLSTLPTGSPLHLSYTEADGWMHAASNLAGAVKTPFTGILTGTFDGAGIQVDETSQGITPPTLTLREATINASFNVSGRSSLTLLVSGASGSRIAPKDQSQNAIGSTGTLTIRTEQPLTVEADWYGIHYSGGTAFSIDATAAPVSIQGASGAINGYAGTLTLDGDITLKGGFLNEAQSTIALGANPNIRIMADDAARITNEGTAPELLQLLFDVAPEVGKTVRVYEDVTPVVPRDFAADGTSKLYAIFAPPGKHYTAWMGETRLQNAATDLFEGGKTHDIFSFAISYWSNDTRHTDARPKVYSFKSTFPIDLPTGFPDDEGREIIGWSLSKTDTDNFFTQLTRPATDADFKSLVLYSVPTPTVTITTAGEEVTISKPKTTIKGQNILAGNIILNTIEGVTFDQVATDILTIGPDVDFTLDEEAPQVSVAKHVVNNGRSFADWSGTVMKVLDSSGATLLAWEEIGNQFLALPGTVTYAVPVTYTSAAPVTVTLQQRPSDNDSWVDVPPLEGTTANSIVIPVNAEYSRLVFRSGNTTLCTNRFTIVPACRLTLTTVEGATLKPHEAFDIYPEIAPGEYAVPLGDFAVTLTLHDGYKQNSNPVVKANGEVVPFNATFGAYHFMVPADVTVTVEGVVKDAAGPDPVPTYTVTLPDTEGATLNPAAGAHTLSEGDDFTFTLTLQEGYKKDSHPVVKADGTEITPDASTGAYLIPNVTADMTVTIEGIVKDNPTSLDEVGGELKVWGRGGILHISTPTEAEAYIFRFTGQPVKTIRVSGEAQVNLPQGAYIVKVGGKTFKVIL